MAERLGASSVDVEPPPGVSSALVEDGSESSGAPESSLSGQRFSENLVGAVSGQDVGELQRELAQLGFDPGDIDAVYGSDTAAAVTAFQRARGLTADGIAGPNTLAEMQRVLAAGPAEPRLSPTVARVLDEALPDDTAVGLTARVFAVHSEYAGGKVGSAKLVPDPAQPRFSPSAWLSRVRELLDPLRAPVLHGRVFVVALALLDPDLRSQLDGEGIFGGLVDELPERLETLLSPVGRKLLEQGGNIAGATPPLPDPSPPADGPIQLLAGATVDTVPEPGDGAVRRADRLGITAEVEMLVSVLVAKDTPLPLAVGLFGDWGTGKSFFMSEMEERTAELSALAADGRPEGAPFCKAVRQIRFNAWHYADSDLWASVATTLFDQLARAAPSVTGQPHPGVEAARQELAEAQARKAQLAAEVKRLEHAVERPSAAIRATTGQVIGAVRNDPDLRATLKREADPASGNAPVGDPTEQLVTVLGDIDGTTERVKTLWQLAKEEALHRHRLITVVTVVVIAVILGGIWTLAGWAGWAKILSTVAGVIAVASPALVMAIRILTLARQARQAREQPLLDKRAELAEVEREIARREQDLAALRDQGQRLQEFVRVRAASSVYRDRLGVISQVRTDFEELVSLIDSARLADQGGDTEQATAARAVVGAAAAADVAVPTVDRIVLYIDDLDRCPPQKVVDVLQAVHLLLAFKLFVVVVGVDSRWLERSLEMHFADMLDEPDDYLEKIFQIPFALRRMTRSGYRDLINGLTPPAPAPGNGSGHQVPAATASGPATTPAGIGNIGTTGTSPGQPMHDAVVDQSMPTAPDATSTQPSPPPPPRLEALFLTDPERSMLQQLGAVIATPRSAKRLINIYRMLRVSVPADELDRYRPDGGSEYQCVIILLAILIGRPDDAPDVFGKILAAPARANIWAVLESHGELLKPLRELPGVVVTDVEPYARWAPRVARFSFRLASTTHVSPDRDDERAAAAPPTSARSLRIGPRPSTSGQYRAAVRRRSGSEARQP